MSAVVDGRLRPMAFRGGGDLPEEFMSDATAIKDLKIGMKNFNTSVIVLEVSHRSTTNKEGLEVRACKVADRTACINLVVPEQDIGAHLKPSDICKITQCFVSNLDGSPTLYIGKGGTLAKVSEYLLVFNETINMSEPNSAVSPATGPKPQLIPPGTTTTTTPPLVAGGNNHAPSTTPPVLKID